MVPSTGALVSRVIEAEAAALTVPAAFFHQARTVLAPSPAARVTVAEPAAATQLVQVVLWLRHIWVAVPVVTARVAVTAAVLVYLAPPARVMVPAGAGSTGAPAFSEAHRSRRGLVRLLRASFTGTPLAVRRVTVAAGVSAGKAARSTAMAPATCGVACEVPDMVMPAAVMATPGASMVRNEAEQEKQVT